MTFIPRGVGEAAAAVAAGRTTAVALAGTFLERIARDNPRLGALTEVFAERALADAARIDALRSAGRRLPPLAGVPVVVKDIIDTTPGACCAGLEFLRGYRPARDADAVRRLRRAGAVVLGVAATDPGAFGVRTAAVSHPFAPERTVGGSSGGSAAAVAAGLCLAALGTDTGGSVRIPAACCAVAGFKPTFGRVDASGVRPLAPSLDHVGVLAPRAADIAPLRRTLDPRTRATRRRRGGALSAGFDPGGFADADARVLEQFERVLEACRAAGVEPREVRAPRPDEIRDAHLAVFCAEAAVAHADGFARHAHAYPLEARRLIDIGNRLPARDYVRARARCTELARRMDDLLREIDFLLLPTLPLPPPRRDAPRLPLGGHERDFTAVLIRYTCLFNHTGHPVLALPIPESEGAAGSVQIVGARDCDAGVLELGVLLEERVGTAAPGQTG